MGVTKTPAAVQEAETGADSSPQPLDINLEQRKEILRREFEKIFPVRAARHKEHKRIKQAKFDRKKIRRKIAKISRKRNTG